MKKSLAVLACLAAVSGSAACTSGVQQKTEAPASTGAEDKTPVTLTVTSFFTDKEKGLVDAVMKGFHDSHPWVTIKHTGGQTRDVALQSLRGNTAADVMIFGDSPFIPKLCKTGQLMNLDAYMQRDGVDPSKFVKATRDYTTWDGKTCAFPMLSDVYALYYNKTLLKAAGVEPPKTWSEMTTAAQKLTQKNPDGSLKRAGFLPLLDWAQQNATTFAPGFNLKWYGDDGKVAMATDPSWAKMLTWQKSLMNFYGADQMKTFRTKLGDELATTNPFYTGQIAMMIDGEWRVAFLAREKPDLDYGVMPIPNDDPQKYGGGYISGTVIGVTRSSKHQEAAWQFTKYMATDDAALHQLANSLKNVPTTQSSLTDKDLRNDPHFGALMDIAANPNSSTLPATLSGTTAADLFKQKMNEWQFSADTDPAPLLQKIADQANASIAQNGN